MKVAEIYCNGILAGLLTEENRRSFIFRYEDSYFNDISKPAVSLTLSKIQQEYRSEFLFPFLVTWLQKERTLPYKVVI